MFKVEIDYDVLQTMIKNAIDAALESHSFTNSLPPILNRTQFMELLDIGATKAAELFNRKDFPVIREFGHPKILTHQLMQWCEQHSEWVSQHAGPAYPAKRAPHIRRAK
ncbi:DNA-binding protein [Paenibacillus aurantiacus]|uniref:DNA-binding protein n=1 Tax=Paenibacillus aurantiacus TaxID=1936118 RepID=A0ABV5KPZ2_9BACL